MEKTTVYLTDAQKAALARAAAAEGRSEARLIRAGIDVVTARHRVAEVPAAGIDAEAPADTGVAEGSVAGGRPRWLPRDAFVQAILRHPADTALLAELRALAPDTTEDAATGMATP